MADLSFTKMHGCGNDFIIIDNRERLLSDEEIIALAPELCCRRFGIGADGIMALQKPDDLVLDYTMFYRNADGSDAGMCGNGARCLALFAAQLGLGTQLAFKVHKTVYQAAINPDRNFVTVCFPLQIDIQERAGKDNQPIYQMYAGTEHIVLEATDAHFGDDDKLRRQGRQLRYNNRFDPPGTNVNFIKATSATEIQIKTYERGVENLTLACGTGAIAGAVAWHHIQKNKPSGPVTVQAQGGTLKVNFNYNSKDNFYSDIELSGEAQFVYEGRYTL